MKKLKTILFLFAAIMLCFSSCKKEDDETTPSGPDPEVVTQGLVVKDNVMVIGQDLTLTSSQWQLEDGIYRYSFDGEAPEVNAGDVIVDSLNGGYLRKVDVVSVFGSTLQLETSQASLEDLFEQGSLELNVDLGVPLKTYKEDGIEYELIGDDLENGASTSNYVDYEIDAELSSEVSLTGGFTVEPRYKFKWVFTKENGMEQMHCYLDNSKVELEATLAFTAGGSVSAIVQKSFGSVTKRGICWVYGVPVIFDIEVELIGEGYVSFEEQANFPISYTNTSLLSYGIAYNNGATNFVTGFSNNSALNTTPSFEAKGQVRLNIIPQVNIEFYGVLGNVIKPKPYVELAAQYVNLGGMDEMCAEINAGIDLGLGVRGEIFGEEIFDLSKDFSIVKKNLWKSMDDCVLPIITISDASWEIGTHDCGNNTPYTVTFEFDDPDTLIGQGTVLYAMHRFYAPGGSSTGSITRDWEEMTMIDNTLSYNICIGWVSATYVEQSFYLVSEDGTKSNLISVIIPNLVMKDSPIISTGAYPELE